MDGARVIEKGNSYRFLYIKKVIMARLREMGVDEAVLDTQCVKGPKNFFEVSRTHRLENN